MATSIEKETLIEVLKGTTRQVDFTKMIVDQQATIRKLERMAGGKPNKIEQAYFDQQNSRLKELEDIVKQWIWEAFDDDDNIVKKTLHWHNIQKNFTIKVLIQENEEE